MTAGAIKEFRVRLVLETTLRAVTPEAAFELARWDVEQATGMRCIKRQVFDALGPVLETTENRPRAYARRPLRHQTGE